MTEIPTRNDILQASAERGLLAYLFEVSGKYYLLGQTAFFSTVAELVRSGERTLFAERDWAFLDKMRGPQFFSGMGLICELVPFLEVGHRDMMRFVATLVRLGGEDLATTQPNRAFREWCSGDPVRVQAVIDDAQNGDDLAIDHLCFALEAGAKSAEALIFLSKDLAPKVQMAAIVALGRMTLNVRCAVTVIRSLAEVAVAANDCEVQHGALMSSFSILEKNPNLPHDEARRILDTVLEDDSAETLHALSALICWHGKSLTESELRLVLSALQSVAPESKGTLGQIDHAIPSLINKGHFDLLSTFTEKLIQGSKGQIRLDALPSFWQELVNGDSRRFSKFVVDWLLEGNLYPCLSLQQQFAVADSQKPLDLELEDIPAEPKDQAFVCRKAVGFLFMAPVTAASILVSILRHGDDHLAEDVLALLYEPLLTSFDGELRCYLERIVGKISDSTEVTRINEVLARRQETLDNFAAIETLVELHPSESHRQIEHIRQSQKMAQAMEESMEKSTLLNVMPVKYLLYGTTTSSYVTDPNGAIRRVDAEMGLHSVSVEIPKSDIFDPEGLQMMLILFRCEQRIGL